MNSNYKLADLDKSIVVEPADKAESAVIWLHGLGADGNDFVGILPQLNLPQNHSIRFVFPHAPVQPVTVNGGMAMRSWYDIYSMTIAEKMDTAGINQSASVLQELIQQQLDLGIPANKIVLAGFSQGGLVALHTGLYYSQPLAGILALSTYYPTACLQDAQQQAKEFQQPPICMAHGVYDQVIPLAVAQKASQLLTEHGQQVEWHEYPMEHQVCMPEIELISAWLQARLM